MTDVRPKADSMVRRSHDRTRHRSTPIAGPHLMFNASKLLTAALVVATLATPTARAAAQVNHFHFSVVGGVSHYDFSHIGNSPFGAIRADIPWAMIVTEGSLGIFEARQGTIAKSTFLVPEVQFQYQFAPMRIRPYIGLGGGWLATLTGPADHWWRATGSASVGARVTIPTTSMGVRGEVRFRGVGGGIDGGNAVEYTLGAQW